MSVYVMGQIKVKNEAKWDEYKSLVGDTLTPYNGKVLLRGEQTLAFAGETSHPQIVVIEFETKQKAQEWYNSKSYQKIAKIREEGADVILQVYEN